MASIDGGIPPITSKNMKIGDSGWHNRKTSPYIPRIHLYSEFNRKTSGYYFFHSGSWV